MSTAIFLLTLMIVFASCKPQLQNLFSGFFDSFQREANAKVTPPGSKTAANTTTDAAVSGKGLVNALATDVGTVIGKARNIIAKVYDFMKREAQNEYAEKLSNARWRTATAVGVSQKTVSRILRDRNKKLAGASAAGANALVKGKVEAAKDTGIGFDRLISGNVTGAAHSIDSAVGDYATGDLIGAKVHVARELISTAGEVSRDIVTGDNTIINDVGAGFDSLASGNLTTAGRDFGNAVGSLITTGDTALGNLFQGQLDAAFGR